MKFIRIKRLIFAIKNYKFLKRNWGIKYPFYNALFKKIEEK